MVVWEDQRGASSDIYGMRVTPSGLSLDPGGRVISDAVGMQRHPAIAFNGTNYVVVWEDYRGGSGAVYGARVAPDGSVLDTGGVPVSAKLGEEWAPDVSCDGANCLVVWQTWNDGAGDIMGARLDPMGAVLDPEGITVSAGDRRQWGPNIVFNGTYHIVSWGDARNGRRNVDVYAARVSTLGGVIDPGGVGVSTEGDSQVLPAVASDDSGRLMVAHSWLRPASIFGYWRIWGLQWTPPEEQPLQLTLGVHQNPELTAELDVYLVPSKAVQDTSVLLAVNGVAVEAAATDPMGSIYRGGHRLSSPGALLITARARDLAGILTELSREFSAGFVTASDGGSVAGPGGRVNLRCPGGSVTRDSYVLIDSELLLSPPSLALKNPATLTINVSETDGEAWTGLTDRSGLWPSLWREGPDDWEHIASTYDKQTGILTAPVQSLGQFKVVWGPGDLSGGIAEILLRNVPNPFRSVVDVRYYLPRAGFVSVSVYDAGGRLVRTLFEGVRGPGWWGESWDGTDTAGGSLPSGIYFTNVSNGETHVSKKCILVR
jgi:hypothetical protein